MTINILPHTVAVVRIDEVVDDFGEPVATEISRSNVAAYMQPPTLGSLAGASLMGRDVVPQEWTVFLPAGTAIDRNDVIEHDGKSYEILGLPSEFDSPSGPHHIEVALRPVGV